MATRHCKVVLVEKPFTSTSEQAQELLDVATERGATVFAGYTQRFSRPFLTAKAQVASGQLGDITGGLARFYTTRARAERRLEREPTASPLKNNFPHIADLATWLMGGETPDAVVSIPARGPLGQHENVTLSTWTTFLYRSGTTWTLATSWALPTTYPAYHASIGLDVFGTAGAIIVDDLHKEVVLSSDDPIVGLSQPDMPKLGLRTAFMGSFPPGEIAFGSVWGPMRDETLAFLEAATSGQPDHAVLATGAEALQVRRVVDAAMTALAEGRQVTVDRS